MIEEMSIVEQLVKLMELEEFKFMVYFHQSIEKVEKKSISKKIILVKVI